MTPELFTEYWKQTYPKCPPMGYRLRIEYPEIWFRIHTLPLSKRYPDTEEEQAEILRRHNSILSDLLVDGGEYVLTTTTWSGGSGPKRRDAGVKILGKERRHLYSISLHEAEETPDPGPSDVTYWHFFMTEANWKAKSADRLLRQVANEETRHVLFVGMAEGFVYHPYDGGADIFVIDDAKRDLLKSKYAAWFSQHPSGL